MEDQYWFRNMPTHDVNICSNIEYPEFDSTDASSSLNNQNTTTLGTPKIQDEIF